MSLVFLLGVLLAGLFLSGCFSGAETGLYCLNRLRIRLDVERGDRQAQRLARFYRDERGALTVTLVGTNLMNYFATAAATLIFVEHFGFADHRAEIATVVVLTPIVFVFAEMTPKNLFQRRPNELMLKSGTLLAIAGGCFRLTGAVWALKGLAAIATNLLGDVRDNRMPIDPKRRVALLVREALVGDIDGDEQSDLVARVMNLSEARLHSVMMPRNRVTTIAADADRRELLALAHRTDSQYLPVHEGRRWRIIGAVEIDDLLIHDDWSVVGDRLMPAAHLNAHESVATALAKMQNSQNPLGIVIDRGGLMLGLVTLKDLLQELIVQMES